MSQETYQRSDYGVKDNLQISYILSCGRAAVGHARPHTIGVYHVSLQQQQQLPVLVIVLTTFKGCNEYLQELIFVIVFNRHLKFKLDI
jgi:hypothetical protein